MAIYQTSIIGRQQIADATLEISCERPDGFSFTAGQYIQMGVPKLLHADPKGSSRVFSIASSPLDEKKISVAFRDTGSGFKRTLQELPMGAPLSIEGPHGFFTLPKRSSYPIVFIAGGIGVTPYLSMIRYAIEKRLALPMTLLYANRNKKSAAYLEELQDTARENPSFTLKSVFGNVDESAIRKNIKEMNECIYYVAGPPSMVDTVRNLLSLLSIDDEKVYVEEFAGY